MTVLNTLNFNLNYFVSNLKKRKLSYNNMKISTKKIYSTDFINSIILKYYRHQRCDFHSVTEWRREASRALAALGSLRRGSVPVSAMMSWGGLVGHHWCRWSQSWCWEARLGTASGKSSGLGWRRVGGTAFLAQLKSFPSLWKLSCYRTPRRNLRGAAHPGGRATETGLDVGVGRRRP